MVATIDKCRLCSVIIGSLMFATAFAVRADEAENSAIEAVKRLKGVASAVSVNLARCRIDDDDLKVVTTLKSLRELDLSFTNVTDAAATHIGKCSQLRVLHLRAVHDCIAYPQRSRNQPMASC
jgi:hypothetical protein